MSHVRVNIPAWTTAEATSGLRALLRPSSTDYRTCLLSELTEWLPDRVPQLVASARYGLVLALQSLEARQVAVPAFVCPAVLAAADRAGATVVPVDVERDGFGFDTTCLRAVAGRVDAILATNTYGVDQNVNELRPLGLPVIDDAAYQAGLRSSDGTLCGGRADIGVWSFNFKSLTGVGGGVVWWAKEGNRAELVAEDRSGQAARFANYLVRSVLRHHIPAGLPGARSPDPGRPAPASLRQIAEGPMSELQAAVALTQWNRRDELAARQSHNAGDIIAAARNLQLVRGGEKGRLSHLVPLLAEDPSAALNTRGLLYRSGVQTEDPYSAAPSSDAAKDVAERLVLVPCHASLGRTQVETITDVLSSL